MGASDLTRLTLARARDGLRRRDFSALELAEAYIAAAEVARPLNAFVLETPDRARAMAAESDARLARGGDDVRPLEGLPVAVKDLFCTEGVRTTAASRILETFTPPYESAVTARLWGAGAVLCGKTNLDEFAMGSSTDSGAFGPALNPRRRQDDPDTPLSPGGSSGGSAAAVAAGAALAALGTDTGGSIRQPAALTGTVGLKPTYGRCSRRGIVAFASSLDQAGPMTRTVEDAALLLSVMAGFDPHDSTSADRPAPDGAAAIARAHAEGMRGLRVGVPREYRVDGMPDGVDRLWRAGMEHLRAAGAEVVDVSLPHTSYALPTYYIIAPAEASSNLARYDGVRYGLRVADAGDALDDLYERTRAAGFGAEVRRRILIGAYVLSAGYYDAYYLKAQRVRARVAADFEAAWDACDVLLTPTAPGPAFASGASDDDPVRMYLNDVFTVPASLAGLPALSVPAGVDAAGLPLGLQVVGRAFDEEAVLRAGAALEGMAPKRD